MKTTLMKTAAGPKKVEPFFACKMTDGSAEMKCQLPPKS